MTTFGRVRAANNLHRELLSTGWQLCTTEAGLITTPAALRQTTVDWLDTAVPSTAASSLRQAQRWSLDQPARNFDASDWWYRLRFQVNTAAAAETLQLCFGGLATVADVWLNDEPLLHSENMFRRTDCDVTQLLNVNNELLIRFTALDTLLAMKRPRPRWKAPMIQHQQLRWLRTTLLGRTPGWSPPAAAVGPWREIWLERHQAVHVDQIQLHSNVSVDEGLVRVSCTLNTLQSHTKILRCELELGYQQQRFTTTLQANGNRYQGVLRVAKPTLWWPHTHGEPALYEAILHVTLADNDAATRDIKINLGGTGFRTITLDTEAGNFAIAINGVTVFCRGACWTPPDAIALNSSTEQLEHILKSVRDAGMNMLRVGGTMVYENDEFLDLCDEYGIMLWHDLMFANMDYPETEAFVANVSAEVTQQIARLSGRPCLTVICGNSEGEQQAAMFGATRDRWNPTLFHQTLPALIAEQCPDIPYWPSSAHGGAFPHQNNVGTTSYYGVGAYMRPLEDARRSEVRFATECLAFANVPEDSCIERMPGGLALKVHHPQWKSRTPRDLGAGWDFEDVRDHYLKTLFQVDPVQLRYANHDRYLELSRVVVGEVMAATFNEWRRAQSKCHGALIWFLQDLWPGAGWGVLDAYGNPKSAYYYLRRSLQPQSIALSDEGCNGIDLHLVNESSQAIEAKVTVSSFRHGETLISMSEHPYMLAAHSATTASLVDWFEGFMDLNYAYRFGPPAQDLIVAQLSDVNGELLAETHYLPTEQHLTAKTDLGLTALAHLLKNGDAELHVSTRCFARAVTIQCDGFQASDQYFNVVPGIPRKMLLKRGDNVKSVNGILRAVNASAPVKIGTPA